MAERILIVAAHPDDETLGCGGAIAKHVMTGDLVEVVAFTNGIGARNADALAIERRAAQFDSACGMLGAQALPLYDYQDNEMDDIPLLPIVKDIESQLQRFQPSVVYTHWRGDLNVDHRVVHDAVKVACRPQPGGTVRMLLYFEVPCSTAWGEGFVPDYFSNIEKTFETKLLAAQCYVDELRPDPHPRSVNGITRLAQMRGSQVGCRFAEAFVTGRIVA